MKNAYEVEWADIAVSDLKEIIAFISRDSPANASNVLRSIHQKTTGLSSFPERGRIVPELQDQGITIYRELIVSPWRIIYRTTDNTVFILIVIDSRRNVEDILLKRLAYPGM